MQAAAKSSSFSSSMPFLNISYCISKGVLFGSVLGLVISLGTGVRTAALAALAAVASVLTAKMELSPVFSRARLLWHTSLTCLCSMLTAAPVCMKMQKLALLLDAKGYLCIRLRLT
jgi:hypothetical protein